MSEARGEPARLAELIDPLRAAPAATALLFDIDGTLAPIVSDPEDATVPGETRDRLRELAARYGLVACITGRPALHARWMVGVSDAVYSGNHGLELLHPGESDPRMDPAVADRARLVRDFVGDLDAEEVSEVEIRLESKGPIQALHWRGASNEQAAEERARQIAAEAESAGLVAHWGRKVLEIRPVAGIDKGTAVERLLADDALSRALFGGDDRGDLDAFDVLSRLVGEGRLEAAVRVAVASLEAPPELAQRADIAVDGPEGFRDVLAALALTAGTPLGS